MCNARIIPFPGQGVIDCELDDDEHTSHRGFIRDRAYPGSVTALHWMETDRRTFRGEWRACDGRWGCILPAGHGGAHEGG
jgi:hypothetical protein